MFVVLFFCLLLHGLAVRISFQQVIIVLIQVYNWEIRHHSTVCRCGLVDFEQSLFFLSLTSKKPETRKKMTTGVRARVHSPY